MKTLRWIPVILVLAGLSIIPLAKCKGPGVERWAIKTSVPTSTDFNHPRFVPLKDLIDSKKLPDAPGITKRDKRFDTVLIPQFENPLQVKEGDWIATQGWLHLVALEDDCDYHIQVSDSPTSGNSCLIVEIPKGEPDFVASAGLRERAEKARAFVRDRLLKGKEASGSGNVMEHEAYVWIAGQLFYDDAHVGDQPRGKKGMKAATLWELHPALGMKFAPKPKK